MSQEKELKVQLQIIAQKNFSIPAGIDQFALALKMMSYIGSTDSELRDDLVYTTFATWILKQHLFNNAQLRQLLFMVLDCQYIFYGIGETDTDSVFTRSFSVLLLPLILISHREKPFLTRWEIGEVKTALLKYLEQERDLRGYVAGKGWAHAVAHAADALDDLAQCPEMGSTDLLDILNVIAAKMCEGSIPYIYEEDERMVTAVISVLNRHLVGEEDIEKWMRGFALSVKKSKRSPLNYRHLNVKNFLRSLYFRMRQKSMDEKLILKVSEILQKISHFHY